MIQRVELKIRAATLDDACQIGTVHVASWRETYAELVGAEYLAGLDAVRAGDRALLTIANPEVATLVATDNAAVVGFAMAGAVRRNQATTADATVGAPQCSSIGPLQRAIPAECSGELYSLYLLAQYHGMGAGRALFCSAAKALQRRGHNQMLVWTLLNNPAQGFYRRIGGVEALHGLYRVGERELPTVGYLFSNLADYAPGG